MPASEDFAKIAAEVLAGKKGDLVRARALYDHVIDRMRYMKYGDGLGPGRRRPRVQRAPPATAPTSTPTSSRSPAPSASRPASPSAPRSRPSATTAASTATTAGRSSAPRGNGGRWTSARRTSTRRLSTYYFGHHPANRIELSRGPRPGRRARPRLRADQLPRLPRPRGRGPAEEGEGGVHVRESAPPPGGRPPLLILPPAPVLARRRAGFSRGGRAGARRRG